MGLFEVQQSDLDNLIQQDAAPMIDFQEIDWTKKPYCIYCKNIFDPRYIEAKSQWANVCLDCKAKGLGMIKPGLPKLHDQTKFPLRYRELHLANCRVRNENAEALRIAKEWSENPNFNLLLMGPPGTGKTHIASAACFDASLNYAAQFISVPMLLLKFQTTVKDHSELELIDHLTEADNSLRLFDDVGAHRVSEFSIEMFGLLLERYYANDFRGIIFTTNLTKKEILDSMGERIASRLCGLTRTIQLGGDDMRLGGQVA